MFTKTAASQALIDAVQAVMEADEKKKLLLEPGKPKLEGMIPSEIIAGRLIAKRDGQRAATGKSAMAMKTETEKVLSPFDKGYKPAETPTSSHTAKKVSTGTVYTKNYKAEKDVKEEVEELDELSKKTLGRYINKAVGTNPQQGHNSSVVNSVRASNSARSDYMQGGSDMNTLDKRVNAADKNFSNRLSGIKTATRKLSKEEVEGSHEDEKQDKAMFKKMFKKAEDKDDKSEKENSMKSEDSFDREKREFKRKEHEAEWEVEKRVTKNREAAAQAAKNPAYTKQGDLFKEPVKEERHLTPGEMKTKEHNVKSMKKGLAGFKERYGNRAKSVMYATATKQAMKEEVEQDDPKLAALHKRAQGVSQEHGVAQHINKNDHDNGHHVSDFYDDEKTVATYNKGKLKEDKEPSFTGSHQGKTTIKHIKNPTVQQRMFAHDIKPGIKGYRDRIALLRTGKESGNLKEDELEELDEISTKTLARAAKSASDPDSDYSYGKSHDPQKFADHAKKTKDAKSAAAVQGAADAKSHYPRDNHTQGYDKLSHRTPSRVTAAGKANKQDTNALKNKLKEEEQMDEMGHAGKTTIKHIKNPTVQQRMFAHDIKPGIAGYRDRVAVLKDAERMGNLKKEESEEKNPPFDKPYHTTGGVKKDKYGNIVKNVAKHLAKQGLNQQKTKNEEVEELDELNKDTLYSYTKKAEVDQDKQFTKVGKAIRDNDPETGNKAGHKFSKRSVGLTKAYGKLEKESIGGISSMSEAESKAEGETDMNTKTVDGLRGRVKVPATFHNSVRSYKVALKSEGKHPEDNSVPFVTNETSHTPMKLAKELAKKSFKKIRNETLGLAGGTSEETKND